MSLIINPYRFGSGYQEFSANLIIQTQIAASSRVGYDCGAASSSAPAIGSNTHPNFLRRCLWRNISGTRTIDAGQLIVTRNVGFMTIGSATIDLSTLGASGSYYTNGSAIPIDTTISTTDMATVAYSFSLPDLPDPEATLEIYATNIFAGSVTRNFLLPYGYSLCDQFVIGQGGEGGSNSSFLTYGGQGGGGGGCSIQNNVSLAGLSNLYLTVTTGNNGICYIRETSSSGTICCSAQKGRPGAGGNNTEGSAPANGGSATYSADVVGATKYSGGSGRARQTNYASGGGAAHPAGAGGNAGGAPGTSTAPGGPGGSTGAGSDFGGGGAGSPDSTTSNGGRVLWRMLFKN